MMDVSPVRDDEGHNHSRSKVVVKFTGGVKTLLIPLAARAWDAQSPSPLLGDNLSAATMARLDYDFEKLSLNPSECQNLVVRTLNYDHWFASFLGRYPNAMVVQLGCGLDCRAQRLAVRDNLLWVDVDFPEVIELRHQVMLDDSAGSAYKLVTADVTVPGWLEGLPQDRPTAVVMEGFLTHLGEVHVRGLLRQLVDYFDQREIFLKCLSSAMAARLQRGDLQIYRKTGVDYKFGPDDVQQLEKMKDGFRFIEAMGFFSAPDLEKLPWATRLSMYIASWIPSAGDAAKLVRLGWGSGDGSLDA